MKKDIKFSTRMASEDRATIKELAKQSHMSMSNYVTACCLGQQIVIIEGLKEVLKELKVIGNNLNQISTKINAGAFTSYNFQEVIDLQKAIYEELYRINQGAPWQP